MDSEQRQSTQLSGEPPESPPGDVWVNIYLDHGVMLEERFRKLGNLKDLENAISDYQKAFRLVEPGHEMIRSKINQRLSNGVDIYREKARDPTLNNRLNQSEHHYKLGHIYMERFELLKRPEDLDGAISNLQKSTESLPDGHPDKSRYSKRAEELEGVRKSRIKEEQAMVTQPTNIRRAEAKLVDDEPTNDDHKRPEDAHVEEPKRSEVEHVEDQKLIEGEHVEEHKRVQAKNRAGTSKRSDGKHSDRKPKRLDNERIKGDLIDYRSERDYTQDED